MGMKLSKRELALALEYSRGLIDYIERLAGVRGPEQSLVGESRSDGEPDGAEERRERSERSEERSGVGEIVELSKLLRLIDRKLAKAREVQQIAWTDEDEGIKAIQHGKIVALIELSHDIERMAEKRSDLSNA